MPETYETSRSLTIISAHSQQANYVTDSFASTDLYLPKMNMNINEEQNNKENTLGSYVRDCIQKIGEEGGSKVLLNTGILL